MLNQNQPLVYFFAKSNFGDDQPDFIKIGYTGTNLSLRQAALQTGNEAEIWEMGVIPFETEDEAHKEEERIHFLFGAFRARGDLRRIKTLLPPTFTATLPKTSVRKSKILTTNAEKLLLRC